MIINLIIGGNGRVKVALQADTPHDKLILGAIADQAERFEVDFPKASRYKTTPVERMELIAVANSVREDSSDA